CSFFFFFSSRRRHTRSDRDWSSDVCSSDLPAVTIRKFSKKLLGVSDLVAFGSLTEQMATFLSAAVKARMNIVISGGTGSGKTTRSEERRVGKEGRYRECTAAYEKRKYRSTI